jgi:hypothetical protein
MSTGTVGEVHALRLALDVMACHVALIVAPTTRMEQVRSLLLQLYWDLRPLAVHSEKVDNALDWIACADCGEDDTLDLEAVGGRLAKLRGTIALLPYLPYEAGDGRTS